MNKRAVLLDQQEAIIYCCMKLVGKTYALHAQVTINIHSSATFIRKSIIHHMGVAHTCL